MISSNTNKKAMLEKKAFSKIGEVVEVEGRRVIIKVDNDKNITNLFFEGEIYRNVGIGSHIKIERDFLFLIGKINREFLKEKKGFLSSSDLLKSDFDRFIEVLIIGSIEGGIFERGIKELPFLYNEAFLMSENEVKKIYYLPRKNKINIGRALFDEIDVEAGITNLFASHIGIFGNTGSGKSNTLAGIYHNLFQTVKENFIGKSKFIILDFNGEYTNNYSIVPNKLNINLSTRVSSDKISIDESWLDEEFWAILLQATEKTQKPFLKRALNFYSNLNRVNDTETIRHLNNFFCYVFKKILNKEGVSNKEIDSFNNLKSCIKNFYEIENEDDYMEIFRAYHLFNNNLCREKLNHENDVTVQKLFFGAHQNSNVDREVRLFKSKLDSVSSGVNINYLKLFEASLVIRLVLDTLDNTAQFEHIAPILHRFQKRNKEISKIFNIGNVSFLTESQTQPIVSISLKDVNTEMKKIIPLVITKKAYDQHKENPSFNTLHLIIDEAHNILSEDSTRETESWKDYRLEVFEEIIKEGRKFGIFITISSQRPSDISNTLISQLHNVFIHRLINDNDLKTISKTISFLDKISYDSLPILPAGACIFTGTATETPIALQVPLLEKKYQPTSETINLEKLWCM